MSDVDVLWFHGLAPEGADNLWRGDAVCVRGGGGGMGERAVGR